MVDKEAASELQELSLTDRSTSDDAGDEERGTPIKTIAFGILGLVIIGFLVLMGFGLLNKTPVTGLSGITRINKPAPQIAAQLFDGSQFNLSERVGKPIVINFWASWCVPCRDEQPALEAAWRGYRNSDVLFVGVNIQDEESIGRQYINEFDVTYPNVMDADGRVTVDYGVIGIPATFFINKQGLVERRFVGAIGENQLNGWVEDLIAGVAPEGEVDAQNLEGYRQLN